MDITQELIKRMQKAENDIAEALLAGTINDFNKYQRLVGRAEGLKLTRQIINDILFEEDEKEHYSE